MNYYTRNTTWWADFVCNGKRYRVSTGVAYKPGTTRIPGAVKNAADEKLAQAKQGELTVKAAGFGKLAFAEAADNHLAIWSVETSRKTGSVPAVTSIRKETQFLVKLKEFFGARKLSAITAENIQQYCLWRSGWRSDDKGGGACGPAIINMEIGCLRRIMKRAKLWSLVADDVNIPRPPETIGRALLPEEKKALLDAAASNPSWQTALCASVIAFNSTMRGCELKGLRWANIDLLNETLTIPKSKTEAGLRRIPITPDAFEAFVALRARAELFGPVELSHFVFATYRPTGRFVGREIVERRLLGFDPTRAMISWRSAWRSLTKKAV